MKTRAKHRVVVILFVGVFAATLLHAAELPIQNWPAPAFWSPPRTSHGLTTLGDISSPLPFVGVAPCRQYDSRNFTALPDNTNRAVTMTLTPCGLPVTTQAVSVNITVFDSRGPLATRPSR